ncbi:hypothetical protein N431DRAFT_536206 [Stipitochalara longipes BDJ]|nr:hypothetical protein N431DRAFT_536206 [Stipitochalara longipes BDJ]
MGNAEGSQGFQFQPGDRRNDYCYSSGSDYSQNLQFVGETGVARPVGKFRTVIRSQARSRRQYRRKASEPVRRTLHQLRPRTDTFSYSQAELSNALALSSRHQAEAVHAPTSLNRNLRNDTLDPFGTLCIRGDLGNALSLLHHYRFAFLETQSSTSLKDELRSYAMSDPALLHSVLAHSAHHFSCLSLKSSTSDFLYHKGQAITLLNTRIRYPNLLSADNTTFSAVACMTHLEMVTGRLDSAKIHANGLGALVNSRGGIQALAGHRLSRGFIIWTDTIAALIMDTEPCIPLDHLSNAPNVDWATDYPSASRYRAKLLDFTGLPLLNQETIEVFQGLRHLTFMKDNLLPSHDISELQPVLDMSGRLDRRLIKIIRSNSLDPLYQMTVIFKLFGNAALIHQIMFIRQAPTRLSLSNILSSRIRTLLEPHDLPLLQKQYPDMLLWILMIGGLGGVGTPNQAWYAGLLADACFALGVRARTDFVAMLMDFLWSDQYLGPVSVEFWNEVTKAQGGRGLGLTWQTVPYLMRLRFDIYLFYTAYSKYF